MKKPQLMVFLVFFASLSGAHSNAATLSGLQECQAIKNAAKKADCFDKQTQKMLKEESDKKYKEEVAKAEAEKKASEEKRLAEEKYKIEKAQKILQIVMRVKNRIETGISYRDYSSAISDPKFEVTSYSRESQYDIPDFSSNLLKSMEYYEAAGMIWRFKFTPGTNSVACLTEQKQFIDSILGGEYIRRSATLHCGEGPVIDDALQAAWRKASFYISEAESNLNNASK